MATNVSDGPRAPRPAHHPARNRLEHSAQVLALDADGAGFDAQVKVLIVGAGACGAVAALAAQARGADVLVLERDALPRGSTALSSGLIPAAGTRAQQRAGVTDSAELFEQDIQAKAGQRADPMLARLLARHSGAVIDRLETDHGLRFEVLDGFLYPGHRRHRMHAVAERTGEALIDRLWRAAERAGVPLIENFRVDTLLVDRSPTGDAPRRILGVEGQRPDGRRERIGCTALVLACNGFGGDRRLVRELIPEMADALYFGHAGNQGEAVAWARELNLSLADTGAYQGHGSVAHPHGILITWGVIMDGGIQVNRHGHRFWDESQGYSEAALAVLSQPDGVAWNVYDERVHRMALQFPDYARAVDAGAVRAADSASALASTLGLEGAESARALDEELAGIRRCIESAGADRFGRRFAPAQRLQAPYHAVRVTGALFHTQGGIAVDARLRALHGGGSAMPNLYAAGGAARGVSGPTVHGYLSGNGLLSAVVGGWLAGDAAAAASAIGNAGARERMSPPK